jgi:drug/metabolite transporter (DMT)-like permease
MLHFSLILLSVLLTAGGQLFFKQGMAHINQSHGKAPLIQQIAYGLLNGSVMAGFVLFGAGAILWLGVLAKEEVSYAYPISSLGYIVVLLGSYFLFQETISWARIIGILLIILGVAFIEYSR